MGLDIYAMTTARWPSAVLQGNTVLFLNALRASRNLRILLTNVHPHNLAAKLEHTGLASHLDFLIYYFSTHTFSYPKEDQWLWRAVAEETGIIAEKNAVY